QKCGFMVSLRDCSTAVRLVQQELEIVVALMAAVFEDPVREPPDIDLSRPWTRAGLGILDSELVANRTAADRREALDHMQRRGRAAEIRPVGEAGRVNHQRVAFPAPARVAHPRPD